MTHSIATETGAGTSVEPVIPLMTRLKGLFRVSISERLSDSARIARVTLSHVRGNDNVWTLHMINSQEFQDMCSCLVCAADELSMRDNGISDVPLSSEDTLEFIEYVYCLAIASRYAWHQRILINAYSKLRRIDRVTAKRILMSCAVLKNHIV